MWRSAAPSRPRMASEPVERVLAALANRGAAVTHSGDQSYASCPAHEDTNPSLSISQGANGRALLNCHADCQTTDVVAKLGLTMADLSPSRLGGSVDHAVVARYE